MPTGFRKAKISRNGSDVFSSVSKSDAMITGQIFSSDGEPVCIYDGSSLTGLSFMEQSATNYICTNGTEDCAGLSYSDNFFTGSMVNLRPEYRWFIWSAKHKKWRLNPRSAEVRISLPKKFFKSTEKKTSRFQSEEDYNDVYSRHLANKSHDIDAEYSNTSSKGTWLNQYYIKGVAYKKPHQKRSKVVVNELRGRMTPLLSGTDAIGRWGVVKKDSYMTYMDIYDFGENRKFMLSATEYEAISLEDKVRY